MKVVLKALTYPEDIEGIDNAEEFIAYCARVSNPANQMNNMTADRLIRYLIREKHWSPFEMVSMTLEIETTRDIGRQILRHRSFSFQEFSQRYADVTALDDVIEYRQARLQDKKNRQNSIETDDQKIIDTWDEMQRIVAETSLTAYETALELGVAKEQARAVLPEGMTRTRMYMAGTLRSWIHYCDLRCGNGTQLEHKEVADAVLPILEKHFPNIVKALHDADNS